MYANNGEVGKTLKWGGWGKFVEKLFEGEKVSKKWIKGEVKGGKHGQFVFSFFVKLNEVMFD